MPPVSLSGGVEGKMSENSNEIIGTVNYMKKKGSLKVVLIGFVVGIALLLLGSFAFGDKENRDNNEGTERSGYAEFSEYKEAIKLEIETACLKVSGVRSAYAIVSFDGIGESVYAQNSQSGTTDKTEYVIIGSGSGSHALYLGESLPNLVGIGVVCETDGRESVKSELAAMLASAYGLPLTRVRVVEGEWG